MQSAKILTGEAYCCVPGAVTAVVAMCDVANIVGKQEIPDMCSVAGD